MSKISADPPGEHNEGDQVETTNHDKVRGWAVLRRYSGPARSVRVLALAYMLIIGKEKRVI